MLRSVNSSVTEALEGGDKRFVERFALPERCGSCGRSSAGGFAVRLAGPGALFAAIAMTYLLLTMPVLLRMRRVARPTEMHSADYVAATDAGVTAPVYYDPRNKETPAAAHRAGQQGAPQ